MADHSVQTGRSFNMNNLTLLKKRETKISQRLRNLFY